MSKSFFILVLSFRKSHSSSSVFERNSYSYSRILADLDIQSLSISSHFDKCFEFFFPQMDTILKETSSVIGIVLVKGRIRFVFLAYLISSVPSRNNLSHGLTVSELLTLRTNTRQIYI